MPSNRITTIQSARMTKKEQLAIARTLILGKQRLYNLLLAIPQCMDLLVQEYEQAIIRAAPANRLGALAKLSLHYNASVKGRNKKAGTQVDSLMSEAVELIDLGDIESAAKSILAAELHPRLYFSQEMRALSSHSTRAQRLYRGIDRRRERLVRAVAGEVEEIAERYFGTLVGEVLDYEDIVQEALLLAHQYTLVYDPSKGARPTKWSSFSYAMVEKALRNFIAERTRNIQVPRYVQDRYRVVKKAMEKTPTEDSKVLAALSNQIIIKKKGSIKEEEIFTASEVDSLMFAVSGPTISLNTFVHDGDEGARALYESIDSGLPNSEEVIGHKETLERFRVLVSEVLDYEETEVLFLRYGLDRSGRSRTINEVIKDHNGRYRNKLHITAMIEKAEEKLIESKDKFEEIKREVYSGCGRH